MKSLSLLSAAAIISLGAAFTGCSDDDYTEPDFSIFPSEPSAPAIDEDNPVAPGEVFPWEAARTAIPAYTDMVLIYSGGRQRVIYNWDKDRLASYVRYYPRGGFTRWMFDAFLFVEFADYGAGSAMVAYEYGVKDPATGNYLPAATKADWLRLVDYYFDPLHNLAALDATIEDAKKVIGEPPYKRQVVIGLPEPTIWQISDDYGSSTTYWGELGGQRMDFRKNADRVKAVCWYIDHVRARFNKAGFKNIELAGFYWNVEKVYDSEGVLPAVASYLHQFNYSFNWIPYFKANNYQNWARYGFDYAYMQPNYFFYDVPVSRLDETAAIARDNGMFMEMEFDDYALDRNGRAYKFKEYMDAFRRAGAWDNEPIAYYQSNNALHNLRNSSNAADVDLYHRFGEFVTTRSYRTRK